MTNRTDSSSPNQNPSIKIHSLYCTRTECVHTKPEQKNFLFSYWIFFCFLNFFSGFDDWKRVFGGISITFFYCVNRFRKNYQDEKQKKSNKKQPRI